MSQKFCHKCGILLTEDAVFCHKCGTRLIAEECSSLPTEVEKETPPPLPTEVEKETPPPLPAEVEKDTPPLPVEVEKATSPPLLYTEIEQDVSQLISREPIQEELPPILPEMKGSVQSEALKGKTSAFITGVNVNKWKETLSEKVKTENIIPEKVVEKAKELKSSIIIPKVELPKEEMEKGSNSTNPEEVELPPIPTEAQCSVPVEPLKEKTSAFIAGVNVNKWKKTVSEKVKTENIIPEKAIDKAKELKASTKNPKVNVHKNDTNMKNKPSKGRKKPLIVAGVAGILFLVIISASLGGGKKSSNKSDNISTKNTEAVVEKTEKLPLSASACIGKDYREIVDQFENAGFSNINFNQIEDLKYQEAAQLDTIATISVDGNTNFSEGQEFDSNTEILMEYHRYQKCTINMDIDFIGNLLFSKYDVVLKMDKITEGTMKHGEDGNYQFVVDPGEHTFTFENEEDSDVTGEITLNIIGDTNIGLKISCDGDKINIETIYLEEMGAVGENQVMISFNSSEFEYVNYKDVEQQFKEAGFTNIQEKPEYDKEEGNSDIGLTISTSIDGKEEFKRGDIFDNDVEVIISYHENQAKDPEIIKSQEMMAALEEKIPLKKAKRVVVAAMTNAQADDVYTDDGNSYDTAKFHAYNDTSGFYLLVEDAGEWTAKDENTWNVKDMRLSMNYYDTWIKVSCDVTKNGENYIVSNVDRVIAAEGYLDSDDSSKINVEHMEPSESNCFLTVPENLVEKGRKKATDTDAQGDSSASITNTDDHTTWVESQFSLWDGNHKELTKLIKKNLNDSKSFDHEETTYVDVQNEEQQNSVNELLSGYGYDVQVNIGDLFILETFTAKNVYSATVKCTALGIVRSDGTVILVDIV